MLNLFAVVVERDFVTIEWASFIAGLASNPILVVVTLLNIGVIVVNGATDAPNAIATVVSTRAMKPKPAIVMAAVCNFLGLLVVSLFTAAVAHTIFNMVDFGGDSQQSLIALMAAMVAIIVWGTVAWYFGIPTSQSHSLIAGLTGAAIALQGSFDAINGAEWIKVVYGILLSTLLGFFLGWLTSKALGRVCRNMDRKKTSRFFRWAQVASGAGVAFMHGAQDGQKFIGVLFLGMAFCNGQPSVTGVMIPIWLMILCSTIMGVGTSVGGERIIKSVGQDMVKLEKYQGFSADLSSALCLLVMTVLGIPVSTTHTKTSAIMGVGAVRRLSAINFGVVRDMMLTWVFTFPGCGLISFVMAKLFMVVF